MRERALSEVGDEIECWADEYVVRLWAFPYPPSILLSGISERV